MDKKTLTQWHGRDILDPKHAEDLDKEAAELEFGQNMSRSDAENKAYKNYKVKRYLEGAAHHWKGFTAASAVSDPSSKEHKLMYDVYMRALGHNPASAPPPEVKRLVPESDSRRAKFMPHPADQLPLLRSEQSTRLFKLANLLKTVQTLAKFDNPPKDGGGGGERPRMRPRKYQCATCGFQSNQTTNHTGSFYAHCPSCSWKGQGYIHPEGQPPASGKDLAYNAGGNTYRVMRYMGEL